MISRRRAVLLGVGAALAVSLPGALLAQILDAATDGDVPAWATVLLLVVVLIGPVVGGWAVATRGSTPSALVAAAVGAIALGLVAGLGALRRNVAGDDPGFEAVPALMVVGAVLAVVGAALGGRRAARTRP